MTFPATTRTQHDDRYTVERTLGETPCGPVLLATDGARKRTVAIFTLPAERQTEDRAAYDACLARFRRGAEVSRLVRHPNLIETYDVTSALDGAAHSVVEYVDGPTLQQQLASAPLDTGRAVAIAHDVSRALAALHAADIVHRDVAPANILIVPDGGAKLTGYGEAQIGRADLMYGLRADRPGTSGYVSPEQESGLGGVDARSDLYSLGAILYEMLTGGTYAARQRTLALARPDLPPALAALVTKLLERQPAFRAQRADDVARELDAILRPPAPAAPEPSPMPTPVGASLVLSNPPPPTTPPLPPLPVEQFTLPPSTMTFSPSLSPTPAIQPPPSSLAAPPIAVAPVAPAPPRPQRQRQPPPPQGPPQQQPMYPPPPYPVVPPAQGGLPPVQYGAPPQRPGGNVFTQLPAYGPRPAPPPAKSGSGRKAIGIIAAVIVGFLILRNATPSSRTTAFPTATRAAFATATRILPTATRAVPTTTSRVGSASAGSGTVVVGSRTSGTSAAGTLATRAVPQGTAAAGTRWADPKGRISFTLPPGWRVVGTQTDSDVVATVFGDGIFMLIRTATPARSIDAEFASLRSSQSTTSGRTFTQGPVTPVAIGGEMGQVMDWRYVTTSTTPTTSASAPTSGVLWLADHGGTRFSFLVADLGTARPACDALIASVTFP